jgi:hypothetical protein
MQYLQKYRAKKVMKFQVLKVEITNSTMSGSQSFRGSFMIPVDGMKMFWKYELAVWWSIQNIYSHFTKVTRKCKCFSRIVEPCNTQVLVQITEIFMDHKFVSDANIS